MIYHIANLKDWERALESGYYASENYHKEGFIPCATINQIKELADRFFSHLPEIFILHIVEKRIKHLVHYKTWQGLPELFPLIYGKIPLMAIENVSIVDKDSEGNFDWQNWKYY
ncbi:MAG: DUF952 domain-containing protein [Bacteroidia bacterium]|nr:DUF952 domain-containing protein [Bacteroidia bacterium]MDW8157962.1 DUF952 domain-containing protein [Bacteroidia bacterium]